MRKYPVFLNLFLITVLLAACAQAASPAAPEPGTALPSPAATLETAAQVTVDPTEEPVASPLSIATSRGPELHATDPATVSLASGGLQLVEFFRFT